MFVTGSLSGSSSDYIATELLDLSTLQWSVKTPYQFDTRTSGACSLYHQGKFLIFGGWGSSEVSNRIDSFDPSANTWTSIGQLRSKRSYTSVIEKNNEFLIVGALYIEGDKQSEKCIFKDDKLICEYQSPTMNDEGCRYILLIHVIIFILALYHVFPMDPKYCQ